MLNLSVLLEDSARRHPHRDALVLGIGQPGPTQDEMPLAVIALLLLQRTLRLPTERKEGVSIDWFGAALLTAGVSVLLIWVSFAGKAGYYDWFSRESALYVGSGVLLLVATVVVESRVKSPIIPLAIVTERTTGLAIVASIAVGVGMFGSTTFLGQYFQTARGYSPTMAGVLTIPLVMGMLVGSTGSGQLITRFGKWKSFVVTGGALLVAGFGLLSTLDHATDLWLVGRSPARDRGVRTTHRSRLLSRTTQHVAVPA
ncbi:hypothetical protein ACWDNR_20550, partial [Gordonia aichiensis]